MDGRYKGAGLGEITSAEKKRVAETIAADFNSMNPLGEPQPPLEVYKKCPRIHHLKNGSFLFHKNCLQVEVSLDQASSPEMPTQPTTSLEVSAIESVRIHHLKNGSFLFHKNCLQVEVSLDQASSPEMPTQPTTSLEVSAIESVVEPHIPPAKSTMPLRKKNRAVQETTTVNSSTRALNSSIRVEYCRRFNERMKKDDSKLAVTSGRNHLDSGEPRSKYGESTTSPGGTTRGHHQSPKPTGGG
ncbi:hypothetical protein EGW08_008791 [Elysia chlorotica]|uniref:Uncharacterized protein n=1 Tax=Elysia chlorotica TaxID=188477 RepID=A0A3S1BA68_ELYCH|nr:hypothetical protein EGW08_008791 [Elysia chlorotica]